MIFLRYESFRSYLRLYPGTVALICLNLIYFVVIALNGDPANGLHIYRYGAFITDVKLDPFGLDEPWRYITSMFMHAGIDHLLYNMFALLVFAPPLERLLKTSRYIPYYLLCGIGGNILAALMAILLQEKGHLSVGASGAIYGIYGAYLFIALFRKSMLDDSSRKTVYMILIFGVIYSVIMPRIDLWGHVGGAVTGFMLYRLFDRITIWKKR